MTEDQYHEAVASEAYYIVERALHGHDWDDAVNEVDEALQDWVEFDPDMTPGELADKLDEANGEFEDLEVRVVAEL
jgi:hypothetical protein